MLENHQEILELKYRVRRTLFSGESDFQQIDSVETDGFGRMLFNDSVAMISDEASAQASLRPRLEVELGIELVVDRCDERLIESCPRGEWCGGELCGV